MTTPKKRIGRWDFLLGMAVATMLVLLGRYAWDTYNWMYDPCFSYAIPSAAIKSSHYVCSDRRHDEVWSGRGVGRPGDPVLCLCDEPTPFVAKLLLWSPGGPYVSPVKPSTKHDPYRRDSP